MTLGTPTLSPMRYRGNQRARRVALPISSYTAGGEVITPGNIGMGRIDHVQLLSPVSSTGYLTYFDQTNLKFLAYQPGGSVTDLFSDSKGGTSANQVASGSAGVNDAFVHALTNVTAAAVSTAFTNPDYARNVRVVLKSSAGGTLPASCGTCTIVGTDQYGAAASEAVDLSPVNSVVLGAGGIVFVKSTKVFATVTSYQFSIDLHTSVADIQASIGLGTKLGLRSKLGATGDVKVVQKNTAAVGSGTYTADATVMAVEMGANLADNDDVYIESVSRSAVEVTAATNIGTVDLEVFGA